MYIRHLDIYTNHKTQVFPLSMLKDIRLGIDGNVWLKRVLQSASEQYYSGIGGTPSGLRKAIEKELENFKGASIHPLFVFSGLALIRKEKPHVSDEGKTTKRNAAWESVNAGKMDVALSYWNQSHAIHQPDLIHLVMRILKEHGIDYIRAPYDAGAQLVYLEHNPKQIIHATYAGPELLMFDVERVITSIDFSKQSFSAVSKKTVLQDLMLTDDQFLDLCILAGGDQCSTFPSFVQSAFAPASVERLVQHRTGFNLIKSNANDQQISKYVDVYFRVRCAVRHHPVLTDDGHVEPMNADQAPNDIHEFIGYCLPNEVYYYISRGLISDAALNALLCRYGAEFSPLCNGETKEYRNFLSGDIMKIKAQTITLIQSQLNTFYNDRKVSIIHWYDNSASTAQEHVVKPELAPVKVSDISNWKSGKQSVEKELKKVTTPTYSFALGLVANPSDAAATVLAKDAEKPAPLGTLAEVQTRHISKLLQLRSFIETSHVPSPYGKAILDAYKAHPTAPSEFQDALFIALELVRSELLTSRPYSISYNKKPVLEDEAATKAVRLVSRTVSLIGARFKGTKSWAGPLNRDLLAFNSVNKVLTRNLRHLSEALILQMLLNNECQREELDFTDLATQLPFAYEPSTVLGILVKEYLETLALNSSSSSGSNNKEQALKQVEENIGATSASSLSDTIKEEVQRGFAFWDLVFDAVKSLGSAVSKELLQEFQDANNWIKSRKV